MTAILDLARELVALPGWEWRPGMLWVLLDPVHGPFSGRVLDLLPVSDDSALAYFAPASALPALDDPATAGALLGLIRAQRPEDVVDIGRHPDAQGWAVGDGETYAHGASLGEAAARWLIRAAGRRS